MSTAPFGRDELAIDYEEDTLGIVAVVIHKQTGLTGRSNSQPSKDEALAAAVRSLLTEMPSRDPRHRRA